MAVSNEVDCRIGVEFEFISRLPDQVLAEILIRLPSKSACRFKVVCKEWCSLISSSYFISLYTNHCCQDTCKNFTLLFLLEIGEPSPQRTLKYSRQVKAVSNYLVISKLLERKPLNHGLHQFFMRRYEQRNMLLPFSGMKISVLASCHDLLLCSDSWNYIVFSLDTREWVTVPPVPQRVGKHDRPNIIWGRKPGLLCDHNENGLCKFKLILVPLVDVMFHPRGPATLESSHFRIDMYCSETREWSVVNVKWHPLKLNAMQNNIPTIAHDGMLHWLNIRSLVSVDPFSGGGVRLSRAIKLPTKCKWVLFGLCGSQFRVVGRKKEEGNGCVFHVWDLQNGHDNKSWLLSHKIVLAKSALEGGNFTFVAVHPCDTDAIFVMTANIIYLFNLRTDRLEEFHKLKLQKDYRCGIMVGKAIVLLHQRSPSLLPSR